MFVSSTRHASGTIGTMAAQEGELERSAPIDAADIRPALEAVVDYVRDIRRRRPVPPYPTRLRVLLERRRLHHNDLRVVQREVERNDAFRAAVADALDDSADPIAVLWLGRPHGWEASLAAEIASRRNDAVEEGAAAEKRRREAAERRADRAEHERDAAIAQAADADTARDAATEHVAELAAQLDQARDEISRLRTELRHSEDRRAAAAKKEQDVRAELDAERSSRRGAEQLRNDVLASQAADEVDRAELESAIRKVHEAAESLRELVVVPPAADARRTPVAVPGRLTGRPVDQAAHLLRAGASVLIDGYNVTLTHRGTLTLPEQRDWLVQRCEQLRTRWATDMTIVFDGDDVDGAHQRQRRLIAVMWSPAGVDADDVIRDEIARLPSTRPIVVVTDDRAIRDDARAAGCNLVDTAAFVAVLES